MGVPRLFRLLVERYPLILRDADEFPTPDFDNLYLDFNGIVHTATHNNETSFSKTQEEMMLSIFAALERLFSLVEPNKLLFLAIDGVAPRAKMNQQRQRRFRSARLAEAEKEKPANPLASAVAAAATATAAVGDASTPVEKPAELTNPDDQKLNQDQAWQGVEVVLSGHLVPGEGEHKIMEFIRAIKSQTNYDANTRHCLHGLDADLILLGLATHEPHFVILREKVIMRGRPRSTLLNSGDEKKAASFQTTDEFQFLHLGLLREYIQLDFQVAGGAADAEYDLERTIDDFVFMSFLLGNDFLPHLPTADLDEGGLGNTFKIYRRIREVYQLAQAIPEIAAAVGSPYLIDAAAANINIRFLEDLFQQYATLEDEYFDMLVDRVSKDEVRKEHAAAVAAGATIDEDTGEVIMAAAPRSSNVGSGGDESGGGNNAGGVGGSDGGVATVTGAPPPAPRVNAWGTLPPSSITNFTETLYAQAGGKREHVQKSQKSTGVQKEDAGSSRAMKAAMAAAAAAPLPTSAVGGAAPPDPSTLPLPASWIGGASGAAAVAGKQQPSILAMLQAAAMAPTPAQAAPAPAPAPAPKKRKSRAAKPIGAVALANAEADATDAAAKAKAAAAKLLPPGKKRNPFMHPAEFKYGSAMAPQTAARKIGAGVKLDIKAKDAGEGGGADDATPAPTPAPVPEPTPAPTPTPAATTDEEDAAAKAAADAAAAARREADADDEAAAAFAEAQAMAEEFDAEDAAAEEAAAEAEAEVAAATAAALEVVDAAEAAIGDGPEVVDAKTDDGTTPDKPAVADPTLLPPNMLIPVVDKETFYKARFNGVVVGTSEHRQICRSYLEGLQWVLQYYFHGVEAWAWYYPYFACPLASDMTGLVQLYSEIKLDPTPPLLPYQQLLSVLPPESAKLLPQDLVPIMDGALKEFYPKGGEYARIPDPKGREWREVAVIPFMEVDAMVAEAEKLLAAPGVSISTAMTAKIDATLYRFDPSSKLELASPGEGFPPTNVTCNSVTFAPKSLATGRAMPRPTEGCWTPPLRPPPAFPTLKFVDCAGVLDTIGVTVLSTRPSELESVVLKVKRQARPRAALTAAAVALKAKEAAADAQAAAAAGSGRAAAAAAAAVAAAAASGGSSKKKKAAEPASANVKTMMAMGFSESDATMALAMTDDNLEKAVDTVISGGLAEWSLQGRGGNVTGGVEAGSAAARFEEHTKEVEQTEIAEHASAIIGQTVYVGFPFLHQATVVAAHHPGGTWRANKRGDLSSHPLREDEWATMSQDLVEKHMKMMAVDLGPVAMIYEVRRQQGLSIGLDGSTSARFSDETELVPAQLVPSGGVTPRQDTRYAAGDAVPAANRYQIGATCVYLGEDHYGELATVKSITMVDVKGKPTPSYELELVQAKPKAAGKGVETAILDVRAKRNTERYTPAYRVAQSVGCSPLLLSRLTSSLTIIVGHKEHVEVGLGLKFARKALGIPGYSRQVESHDRPGTFKWEFSTAATRMLMQFKTQFADLFRGLERDPNANDYLLTELFYDSGGMPTPDPIARLSALLEWLRQCPTAKLPLLPCASSSLAAEGVAKIEAEVRRMAAVAAVPITMPACAPSELMPALRMAMSSVAKHDWVLGDRVVSIRGSGPVPFGSKGTIVSTHNQRAEVMFDAPFLAGQAVEGKCVDNRMLTVPIWGLLSLTKKRFVVAKNEAARALGKKVVKAKKKKKKVETGLENNTFAPLMDD
eukprot:gene4350-1471_t